MPPRNVSGLGDDAVQLGIDHLVVAEIDSAVGDVGRTGSEENQVARLGIGRADVGVAVILLLRGPGECLPEGLAEDVLGEARAVKCAGTIATIDVWLA